MQELELKSSAIAVVYDARTGRILLTKRVHAFGDAELPDADAVVEEAMEDDLTRSKIADGDAKSLGVLVATDLPAGQGGINAMMVDLGRKRLVPQPHLTLEAERTELEGDGKDSVEIQITVADARGKRVAAFNDEVQVKTRRGKLSARGGVVRLKGGKGTVEVTSVPETVSEVRVTASSLGAPCRSAEVVLSFV